MVRKGDGVREDGKRYVILLVTGEREAYVTNPGTGWAAIQKTFSGDAEVFRPVGVGIPAERLGTVAEVWA